MEKFKNKQEEREYYKAQWIKIFEQFYDYNKEEFFKTIKMLRVAIAIADIEEKE